MNKKEPQQEYGYWRALYLSFYSSRLYVDVAKRWRGLSIGYLLLAVAIASIPLSVRIMMDFNQYFESQIIAPFKDLPILYVHHGEILFDKPMPYSIKNVHGDAISIIDTTGTITNIDDAYPQLKILITRDTLYFRPPSLKQFIGLSTSSIGNKVYSHPFGKAQNGIFDGKTWINSSGYSKLNTIAKMCIYPLAILIFTLIYFIILLVFSTLGQLCSNVFFGLKLKFEDSFRLLTVAATPQIALFFIGQATNLIFPGLGFVYLVLLIAYFFYALSSVKREQAENMHT